MIWISIILSIVEAIPAIIKVIQEIVSALHGHPAQALHEHALMGILSAWKDKKDPVKLAADLKALHEKLLP